LKGSGGSFGFHCVVGQKPCRRLVAIGWPPPARGRGKSKPTSARWSRARAAFEGRARRLHRRGKVRSAPRTRAPDCRRRKVGDWPRLRFHANSLRSSAAPGISWPRSTPRSSSAMS
jgi:hypothetical protein